MGRQKLDRRVMEEHQRSRILEAGVEVFAAKGYPAATVDDVVAAAGIGVGSFYAHFGGKEECLLAAYEKIAAEAEAAVLQAAAAGRNWTAQVCLGLKAFLGWIAKDASRARIVLVEIQTGGARALDSYQRTLDLAAAFLELGRQEGDPPKRLPDSFERTTANGAAWLLQNRLSRGEGEKVEHLFAELAQMILEPYLGEGSAQRAVAEHGLAPSR